MKTYTTGLFVITILGVTGSWFASSNESDGGTAPSASNPSVLPVKTMQLKAVQSIVRTRQFTGNVVAARRSRLAFQRSARLEQVLFDDGQSVFAGQTMAILDQRQLMAQILEMKAQIQQQEAILAELNSGPRSEMIDATKAELAAMSANSDLKKATFRRTKDLYDRRATSEQTLEEVELTWIAADARREATKKKLDELNAGTRSEQIDAQEAVVAGLKARLAQLNIDLDDSELRAPFSGTVVRRFADEGDMLNAQQPVLELLETSKLEAHIGLPSSLIDSLNKKQCVNLTSGQRQVTGKIRNIVSQVNTQTITRTIVIDIDNAVESGLTDGALIRLQFDETQAVDGFRIPLTALAAGSRGLSAAYVVESPQDAPLETHVSSRTVVVLHTDGDFAIVRGAIYEGESIIADGVHRVVPGQQVTVED